MRTPAQDHPPAPAREGSAPGGADPGRANRDGRAAGLTVRLTGGGYILALVALVVTGITLPAAAPGRPASAYVAGAVVLAALLVGSLVLHELGHVLVARRHGAAIRGITVGLLGVAAHGRNDLPGPRAQWRVAAAGPAASLTLAVVLGGAAAGASALAGDRLAVIVLAVAAVGNVVFGLLSLLPGASPDGSRIVRALAWARTGDPARAGLVAARTGQVTGATLAAAGIAVIVLGFTAGLWLVLIGILAFVTSRSEARQQRTAAVLAGLRVRDIVPALPAARAGEPAGVQAWQTVESFIASQSPVDHGGQADLPDGAATRPGGTGATRGVAGLAGSGVSAFGLTGFDGRPAGLLTLSQLAAVPEGQHDSVRLRDIATPVAHVVTTTGDEPVAALLGRLSAWPRIPAAVYTARHALVLTPDGQLAGVLTPADLARAAQLGALRQRAAPAAEHAARPL